jgi:hypothetical protein
MEYKTLEDWAKLWKFCFLYDHKWWIAPNIYVYGSIHRNDNDLDQCREATEAETTIIKYVVKELGHVEFAFRKHGTKLGRYLNEED